MKTNAQWYPYKEHGSYYRLEDGVLLQSPMMADGTRDEEECEVDWQMGVVEEDMKLIEEIVGELEQKV